MSRIVGRTRVAVLPRSGDDVVIEVDERNAVRLVTRFVLPSSAIALITLKLVRPKAS